MNVRTLALVGLLAGTALLAPAASAAFPNDCYVDVNAGPVFDGTFCVSIRKANLVSGGWRSDLIGPGAVLLPNDLPASACVPVDQGDLFTGVACYDRTSGTLLYGGWRSDVIGPGAFAYPNPLP